MSGQDVHVGVGWRVAGACVGFALAEALFFTFLAHFRHPRPLWVYGMPWVLAPAVPVLGLLNCLGRPPGGRILAAARGAFLVGVVLAVMCGVVMVFDLAMSD
ncbi:hypothetical protein [Kutzneria buriramensis]|uniref:Uncharacterized protein n=1 Tax=Kutzneria buriramensis TaxID=1045776 RepID=A0A3E0GVU9_9PSEU|nr:hypothetical protein [Kutzneria buriramensis]REH29659.1 hypothetical protein BCF44_12486 [Kutzneria buriramensis]